MRLRRGLAGTSALVLAWCFAAPEAFAERDTHSPSRVQKSGSIFDYFKRKREDRRNELRRNREPGPRIQNAPLIEADKPEPPLVYQPEKLEALRADSFTETEPTEPLAQAVYRELQSREATARVTRDEKSAIIELYRTNGFKPLWTTADGLDQRGQDVLNLLAMSADEAMEPSDYLPPALGAFSDSPASFKGDMVHLARLDLGLTAMALKYARHASGGRIIPNRLTKYNDITPDPVAPATAVKVLAWSPFPVEYLKGLQPKHPAYALFKTELAQKRAQLHAAESETIPLGRRVKPGEKDPRIVLARHHLERLGYLKVAGTEPDIVPAATGGSAADAKEVLDADVSAALKVFQTEAQIKVTGALDQATVNALNGRSEARMVAKLGYNMERLRWLPKSLGSKYIFVNQAAYQLEVVDNGREVWRTKVIIGKPNTQTVAFHDRMETVVFNPSWGVPPSIIKNEMLPILRRDPSYLDRLGYRVVTRNGQIVRSSSVNWSAYNKGVPYSIQQPPSDDNALGEVKFLFPNSHSIYFHDTPARSLFERSARAFSHGCVRVENPRIFAETLLKLDADEVAKRIDSGVSQSAKVRDEFKVHLTYFTAWPDQSGRIVYYDDVYGRDQRMETAFSATAVAVR
ncbi:L,D-transpeptidase family protein [Aestuariivirga sp. YIM B02566]|uniref:L,D-transpeptidase family protein n=1 Tax=Taklimakanibacter albus TaxID=2800327 RepID=A0ACC5R640_9HYPH|nr:L,D-transpeptidase family protein [Aestuariivirga sp. YIM B02566]MBK1867833.1 L,D-transpeptidase family protein [Aestuariivirga sp. YIM B02566]